MSQSSRDEREAVYPRDDGPHCRTCELPKPVCACADARAADREWKQQQKRRGNPHDL